MNGVWPNESFATGIVFVCRSFTAIAPAIIQQPVVFKAYTRSKLLIRINIELNVHSMITDALDGFLALYLRF